MDTLQRLKDFLKHRSSAPVKPIVMESSGFSVGLAKVDWRDVSDICAYKLDRLTTDEAVLEFELGSGERVPVSEEQPGFDAMEAAMYQAFPTTATWRDLVLQPAFARNYTVLYRRT